MAFELWFEKEFWDQMREEGLAESVIDFYLTTAKLNDRSTAYFVMIALEEFKTYMDQEPGIDTKSVLN